MTALTIGVVGAGDIARRAHLPVLAHLPDVRVTWIADSRLERARTLGDAYGIAAVKAAGPADLPACDVALLAIPVDARTPYLEHFAALGTAVFCEKPFALSAVEHARLVDLFQPHALACGYMRRYFRWAVLLRRLVADRPLGPLRSIEIGEGGRSKGSGSDASFLDDPRLGASRGVLADLGSHGIDLAVHLSDARSFSVESCVRTLDGAVDRQVTADILLGTESQPQNGVELRFCVSWLERQTNQIRLRFDHALVWSELGVSGTVYMGDPGDPRTCIALNGPDRGATTYNQAFYLEWQAFIAGLLARRESSISARSALLTTSIVESLLNTGVAAR